MTKIIADNIKSSCDRLMKRAINDIPEFLRQENWRALRGVTNGACRNILQIAMLELRETRDLERAKEYFKQASDLSGNFTAIPLEELDIGSLLLPLYCCVLADSFDVAKVLSKIVLSENIMFDSSNPSELHTKMLAAYILEDKILFDSNLERFENLVSDRWWTKQKVYFEIIDTTFNKDETEFNQVLERALSLFKQREKDKDYDHSLPIYGGIDYNKFVIDFISVGIAKIAKLKGLNSQIDNEYFPQALI